MKTIISLVKRNRKLYFRDKGMFFTSLITPLILIVLYATFLQKVYKDSFTSNIPEFFSVSDKIINGTVAGQLVAALLAVSCITVTFGVNLTMIQDKVSGALKDFLVSPVRRSKLQAGYFVATFLNSFMVNMVTLALCLGYVYMQGWFLSFTDILLILADVIILVLFGTLLSSIICFPLKTQGAMSAVGIIVSSCYGFISGAYMPISSFGEGLQKVLSYLPTTYGTAMLKNHMLRGVFEEMKASGFTDEVVSGIATSIDCKPKFHDNVVTPGRMMLIMGITVVVLAAVYFAIACLSEKRARKTKNN